MSASHSSPSGHHHSDEALLHRLGYAQVLYREMGGFSNFAISFTIISILAGCLTSYFIAFNNGGPVAITWGWLIIGAFSIIVSMAMGEIASSMPTAGALYFWASKLGSPAWGWFTGWFNLVGQISVTAAIDYGAATFTTALLNLWFPDVVSTETSTIFVVFTVIIALHIAINLLNINLLAQLNTISAWWHMAGVAIVVVILAIVPEHQSVAFVFTETINNSGFGDGMFWFYVLPLGFLLTMYTQTGYDASAHISEETKGAALGAAKGVWRSVFWAGAIGWLVLLAITFAATKVGIVTNVGLGSSLSIFDTSLDPWAAKMVILIATIGQLFCGMACVTSASRMCYAFSRDRAVPGHRLWTRLNHHRVPAFSVIFMATCALIVTLPALIGDENNYTYAFYAVVSITVIGLYIAYVIPTWLRWRMGDRFEPGPWTLGRKYKWINPAAVIWVIICVIVFSLPQGAAGAWWADEFDWKYVNYAPFTVAAVIIAVGLWWLISARHKFEGPIRQVATDDTGRVIEGREAEPPPPTA
jgi:amino acid transporter